MADEQEKIIIEVELDKQGAAKESSEIALNVQKIKEEQTALNKSYRDGKISQEQYVKQSTKLKNESKQLTARQRELTKVMNTESNSIDALRIKLTQLTKQRNSSKQSTLEQVEAVEKLDEEILSLNNRLKQNEERGGDFRRSTGGYRDAMEQAAQNTGLFNTQLGGFIGQSQGAITGIQGMITGLKGLRLAIALTGIGVFVIAITTLVQLFTSSQQGLNILNRGLKAAGATIDVFKDRAILAGKALLDLVNLRIGDAFTKLNQASRGIGQEIIEEAKAGFQIEKDRQALEARKVKFLIREAELVRDIEKLRTQGENQNISNLERERALTEVLRLQKILTEERIAIKQKDFDLTEKANKLGESTLEDERKAAEQRREVIETEAQAQELQRTVRNQISALEKDTISKRKQAATEAKKQQEEQQKAKEQAYQQEVQKIQELQRLQLAGSKLDIEERLVAVKQGSQEELQLKKELIDNQLAAALIGLDRESQAAINAQKQANLERLQLEQQFNEQRKQQRLQAEQEFNTLINAEIQQVSQETDNIIRSSINRQIEAERERLRVTEQVERGKQQLISQTAGFIAQNAKEGTALQKTAAVAQAGYNTYVGANKALAIFGMPFAIPFIASAILTGLGNVREILKLKYGGLLPDADIQYAKSGTILRGKSHAQGGIPVMIGRRQVAEAEGGEPILTKNVSRSPALLQMASLINQIAGGRALTTSRYMNTGGIVARDTVRQQREVRRNVNLNRINKTIQEKPTYVTVQDIERVQRKKQRIEVKANR